MTPKPIAYKNVPEMQPYRMINGYNCLYGVEFKLWLFGPNRKNQSKDHFDKELKYYINDFVERRGREASIPLVFVIKTPQKRVFVCLREPHKKGSAEKIIKAYMGVMNGNS